MVYAIGSDILAQTTFMPAGATLGNTLFFLYDGHGSTRLLTDLAAAIVAVYAYDAYGNDIGFDPAGALTTLLYSGELFDSRVQLQYLRARYYDLSTGRFERLDPFLGSPTRPQTFHKFAYTDNDPINRVDPSGNNWFVAGLGTAVHQAISYDLYRPQHVADVVTFGSSLPGAAGLLLPDIANFSKGEIGEIKPLSLYGVATGHAQLAGYLDFANALPVPHFAGIKPWTPSSWAVGVNLVFPGKYNPLYSDWVAFTLGNAGGVIFYKAIHLPIRAVGLAAVYVLARKLAEIASEYVVRRPLTDVEILIYDYRVEIATVTLIGAGVSALVPIVRGLQISQLRLQTSLSSFFGFGGLSTGYA